MAGGQEGLTVSALLKECKRRGLNTRGCVERQDLELLLSQSPPVKQDPGREAVSASHEGIPPPNADIGEIQAELDAWVSYAPRAQALLASLAQLEIGIETLQKTKLGITVRRYTHHPDSAITESAIQLIGQWKQLLRIKEAPASAKAKPRARGKQRGTRRKKVVVDDDETSSDSGSGSSHQSSSGVEITHESPGGAAGAGSGSIWQQSTHRRVFRGRDERFHVFTLPKPFGCAKWVVRLRISADKYQEECRDLLDQMAVDFSAVRGPQGGGTSAEDQQTLKRLQRLEERFRGNGVTEGEARNAMRLFERELSKANWTEEKFRKLKRQLEGVEQWSAADLVVESSLTWTEKGKRRQAWFADACERVATPLGLEFGYCANGGSCFAGPLSAAAGAALTAALVCHLGDLDLARAYAARGGTRVSAPQFLQGFVDGALERERHLVWEKLFSIEDEDEAAECCRQALRSGFFAGTGSREADAGTSSRRADGESTDGRPASFGPGNGGSDSEPDAEADLHSLLRGLFAPRGGGGRRGGGGGAAPDNWAPPNVPDIAQNDASTGMPSFGGVAFTGKGHRLGEEDEEDGQPDPSAKPSTSSTAEAPQQSWALTFTSNLQLARSSKQRSRAEARRTYHWTGGGHAVKATQTGTESYTRGRCAGEKRRGEIDTAAGSAKQKFARGARRAITAG